jgi:hypothetical protein
MIFTIIFFLLVVVMMLTIAFSLRNPAKQGLVNESRLLRPTSQLELRQGEESDVSPVSSLDERQRTPVERLLVDDEEG